ncbi:MAG: ferrous iron transport protein A [Gammaproteobacteria bacterium]
MLGANATTPLDSLGADGSRLSDLHHGQRGVVVAVHDGRLAGRLAARGLVPGAEFDVLRGGDPMLVRVDESRWALAGSEAALVEVACQGGRMRFVRTLLTRIFHY